MSLKYRFLSIVLGLIPCLGNTFANLSEFPSVPSPLLGGAYSTEGGHPIPQICLDGELDYAGDNRGIMDLSKQDDFDSFKDSLNFTSKAHAAIGLFTADVRFDFFKYLEDDEFSETLIYKTTFQFRDSTFTKPKLNAYGKQFTNVDTFRAACGDSYVAQIHHGASLYIALQFHFTSHTDQTKFKAAFSGSYADLAKFSAELQSQIDKLHISGNIHILALQEGGSPQYLGTIFKGGDATTPSPISQCSLSNLTACNQVITGIVKYISSTENNGFPGQLVIDPKDPKYPTNASITGVETLKYSDAIPFDPTRAVPPEVIQARDDLAELYLKTNRQIQRVNYLQTQINYPFVYDLYQDKLSTNLTILQNNLSLLQYAGQLCFNYNQPQDCLLKKETTINLLKPVDESVLSLPDSFLINEKNTVGVQINNLFVATDPLQGAFRGIDVPYKDAKYDVEAVFEFNKVKMTKFEHLGIGEAPHKIADYEGATQGDGNFTGTVAYAGGGTGTWSGHLTQAELYH